MALRHISLHPARLLRSCLITTALIAGTLSSNAQTGPGNTPQDTIWGNCTGGLQALSSACIGAITGSFFSTDSPAANITRINDRLFVGDLTKSLGDTTSTNDWLCNFQVNTISVGSCYIRLAQFGAETSLNGNSGVGVFGAVQTLDMVALGNVNGVGVEGFAVVNNVSTGTNGLAFYGECHQQTIVGSSGCVGIEIDIRSVAAISTQPDPFTQANLIGVQSACGAGLTTTGHDCGAALQVVKNPTPWRVGLNIVNGSVDSTGPSSTTVGIAMPSGYFINWYTAANTLAGSLSYDGSGNFNIGTNGIIQINGTATKTTVCTVTAGNTYTFTNGLLTGKGANCT